MADKITHWSVFCDIPATLGSAMWVVFTHRLSNVNQTKQFFIGINKVCEHDDQSDAIVLARAAEIVRRDMFENKTVFNGTYDANSQCLTKIQALVSMALEGPNIEKQSKIQNKSACLTIAQLIYFTSVE